MTYVIRHAFVPLLLAVFLLPARASGAVGGLVKARMLADVSSIAPGEPFTVGVTLKLAPDYHVYWINVGDTGIPTKITMKLPDGFTASDVQFPTPHKFDVPGGMIAYGYDNEVMFLATVTAPKDLKPGSDVTIGAKAKWLVCNEDGCVPGDAIVEVKIQSSDKPKAANEVEFEKWRAQIPQSSDQVKQEIIPEFTNDQLKSASGKLSIEWKTPPEKVEWFPAPPDQMVVSASDVKTENGKSVVTFKVDVLPGEKISREKVSDASFFSVLAYTVGGKRVGVAVPISFDASKSSSKGP